MREVTDSLLIQLAGDAAFNKGVRYFEEERVESLRIDGHTITAQVAGTEMYSVTLRHTAKVFEGSCDCPASDGFDFCKHCVATALAYSATLAETDTLKKSKQKDRLPAYLMSLEKKDLVELLLKQLKNDRTTLNQLKIKADIAAGKMTGKEIRKQITSAIPCNRNYFQYRQVREFFGRIETVLQALKVLIAGLPAAAALETIDYAYERIDRALETIDDSGGFRFRSLELLAEMHQQSLTRAGLSPADLAAYLFHIYTGPVADFYPNIPEAYQELLGSAGQQLFLDLVRQTWDALPPLNSDDWGDLFRYRCLQVLLLEDAEQRGDSEAILALHTKTAVSFKDFIDMVMLCLTLDRLEQATWWYERAKRAPQKPFHSQIALEDTQIAIWLYRKDMQSVSNLLWKRFAKLPTVEQYHQIVELLGGEDSSQQEKAIRLTQQAINEAGEAWHRQRHLDTLAALYLLFSQSEPALDLAENNKLHPGLLVQIGVANSDQPARALVLIFRMVDAAINVGNNNAYLDAVEALQAGRKIAGREHWESFRSQLQGLLVEYKRKRNFCLWARKAFKDIL